MKVLYIPSGYIKIYQFFDRWILNELQKNSDIEVQSAALSGNFSRLKSVCKQFQPDIIFTMLGDNLPPAILHWMKNHHSKSVVWLTEDPYYTDRSIKVLPYFDYVFSIDCASVDYYKSLGYKHIYHLPLGTDPAVFRPRRNNGKMYDISLIGYPYPDRIRIMSLLLKETPYKIQIVGNKWRKQSLRTSRSNYSLINRWLPPLKVAELYSNGKIILNTHRPFNEKSNLNTARIINRSINNRTFDIAACGSFQLIQFMADLPEHFEEQEEIVSFKSDDELLSQIDYYLSNEEERNSIAAKGRKKVLQQHTFYHRLDKILNIAAH
jgi:spore maturation protein CgeB